MGRVFRPASRLRVVVVGGRCARRIFGTRRCAPSNHHQYCRWYDENGESFPDAPWWPLYMSDYCEAWCTNLSISGRGPPNAIRGEPAS